MRERAEGFATFVLAAAGIVAAFLYLAPTGAVPSALRFWSKPLPALCMAAWVLARRDGRYGALIAVGLLLSALGDTSLDVGGPMFLAGMVAFLSAHGVYTAAFVRRSRAALPMVGLVFAAWGTKVYVWILPGLGAMALPVAVYVAVICAMMWRAVAAASAKDAALGARYGAMGAVLFGVSDTLISMDRWDAPMPTAGLLTMIFYWGGQTGIALSVIPCHFTNNQTGG